MNELEPWEIIIIVVVAIVFVSFGMTTLYSQINYGSMLAVFSGNAKSRKQLEYLEKQEPAIQTKPAIVRQDLNFRPAPNTNSTPYYILKSGTRVNVISVQNGWARITDSSGREGYVGNTFLRY